MYYQPETKKKFETHSEIRSTLGNVLFPPTIDDDMLAYVGVFPLAYQQPPIEANQVAEPVVVEEVDGVWTQMWTVRDATVEEIAAMASPAPTREQLKQARQAAVDAITVTVGDKVFDGDETSQERMARALRVSDITGLTSCAWVLHDNTAVDVTRDELAQALALAMQAQGAIWVIPV